MYTGITTLPMARGGLPLDGEGVAQTEGLHAPSLVVLVPPIFLTNIAVLGLYRQCDWVLC